MISLLSNYPQYYNYYKIGAGIVGVESTELIATAAIDAIIRFCWSSELIKNIEEHETVTLEILQKLPCRSFPDSRFESFRKEFNSFKVKKLIDAMLGNRSKLIRELASTPSEMLSHPYASTLKKIAKKENSVYILTPEIESIDREYAMKNFSLISIIKEEMAQKGYEYLERIFKGTVLSAMSLNEIEIFWKRKIISKGINFNDCEEIPEVSIIRSSPVKINIQFNNIQEDKLVFLRRYTDFIKHMKVVDNLQIISQQDIILYAFSQNNKCNIETVGESNLLNKFLAINSDEKTVAIWASSLNSNARRNIIDGLFNAGWYVWLICDLSPRQCIKDHILQISEVRGFLYTPDKAIPGIVSLIVPNVEENGSLEGIIFMGTKSMALLTWEKIITSEYGSNCRGFGKTPITHGSTLRRDKIGELISTFSVKTESFFKLQMEV